MHPIKDYQFAPKGNESFGFSQGFVMTVVLILFFAVLIIGGLTMIFRQTTNAANARLVYLAARAKAIEFEAQGNYHVPVQADLIDLIGEAINQDAQIRVVDDNRDGIIDYVVYTKNGWATRYSPGQTTGTAVAE